MESAPLKQPRRLGASAIASEPLPRGKPCPASHFSQRQMAAERLACPMVLGLEMPHKPRLLRFFTALQTDALKDGRRQHVSVLRERRYNARLPMWLGTGPRQKAEEADMDRALDRVCLTPLYPSVSISRSNTAPGAWPPTRVAIARSLLSASGGAIASCSCERLNECASQRSRLTASASGRSATRP